MKHLSMPLCRTPYNVETRGIPPPPPPPPPPWLEEHTYPRRHHGHTRTSRSGSYCREHNEHPHKNIQHTSPYGSPYGAIDVHCLGAGVLPTPNALFHHHPVGLDKAQHTHYNSYSTLASAKHIKTISFTAKPPANDTTYRCKYIPDAPNVL